MDLATIFGIVISLGLLFVAVLVGGDPRIFLDAPAAIIVFGGTLGATLTHYPLGTFLRIGKIIRKTLVGKTPNSNQVIEQFMDYAGRARREGILALESIVRGLDDAYLRKGLQLTVDGLEPDAIQSILETEIGNTESRHETGVEMLSAMAAYSPALGLIGTVLGLVQMLKTMNDPDTIGPALSNEQWVMFEHAVTATIAFLDAARKARDAHRNTA